MISDAGARKLRKILSEWSNALRDEIDKHALPNSFGVREMAGEYRLNPRDGYRLGTTRLIDLRAWTADDTITYKRGRFYVEAAK